MIVLMADTRRISTSNDVKSTQTNDAHTPTNVYDSYMCGVVVFTLSVDVRNLMTPSHGARAVPGQPAVSTAMPTSHASAAVRSCATPNFMSRWVPHNSWRRLIITHTDTDKVACLVLVVSRVTFAENDKKLVGNHFYQLQWEPLQLGC